MHDILDPQIVSIEIRCFSRLLLDELVFYKLRYLSYSEHHILYAHRNEKSSRPSSSDELLAHGEHVTIVRQKTVELGHLL